MPQTRSYQGETAAVIIVGIFFGLLVLTFGVRACFQMVRLCFRRTRDVESQQSSIIVDNEKGFVSSRTSNRGNTWKRVPAILVKLGYPILRGNRTSVHTARPALINPAHAEVGQEVRPASRNEITDEDTARNTPGPNRTPALDDVRPEFRFPQIQKVPRRPSVAPPEDVYNVLERAESWWFPPPTPIPTLTTTSQSECPEHRQIGPTKTVAKRTRHHQRCCPLLGSQGTSAPTLVVLITPPTPPKSIPDCQTPECLNSPGLHPTLGYINSLEAQGRERPTPRDMPRIPDGLEPGSGEGDECHNMF